VLWPKENTAFLVIHGTGEQKPFWILDLFTRNFWNYLESKNYTTKIEWQHELLYHKENEWDESYISLIQRNKSNIKLDFYEYYWDIYMSGTTGINIGDLGNLLRVASDGAENFYKSKHSWKLKKYEIDGIPLFKGGKFITGGYLRILRYFNLLVNIFSSLSINSRIIKSLVSEVLRYFINIMADFIIYLNPDVRSDYYAVRQKILGGAVEEIKLLTNVGDYKQIIIVAHSLGSAIAYDALNFINRQNKRRKEFKNIGKIKGLVTFGSPLDKVAFFFNEHPGSKEFVREQLLKQRHGFKKEYKKEQRYPTVKPFASCLNNIKWLNFWHKADMVSGKLDCYDFDEKINRNIRCSYRVKSRKEAHTHYWKYPLMYEEITKTFF
jgi:hypothetical protein